MNIFGGILGPGDGGFTYGIWASERCKVNIHGSGFNYGYRTISPTYCGTIKGTLADGTPLNTSFYGSNAIYLLPVPEPSAIAVLGLGLAGLIGYGRKRLRVGLKRPFRT